MILKDIGEFGFIDRFKGNFTKNLPAGMQGIGDDCAVIPSESYDYVVTTDMLVEDVHFITKEIGGYQLGKKSLAVNLSDIAAEAGEPVGSFLSLAVPSTVSVEFLDEFMKGYAYFTEKYNCPLLGGDTTKSLGPLVINVTVIGRVSKGKFKTRSSAQKGDFICVTGPLGDSGAGLDFLLNPSLNRNDNALELIHRHHNPEPRIPEGMFFASRPEVHAMMDISDGIGSDMKHILDESKVSALIELERLPLSDVMQNEYGEQRSKMYKYAVTGGEDYELLLTVDSSMFGTLNFDYSNKFGKELFRIGKIIETSENCKLFLTENGWPVNSLGSGFDHFMA
jgi:thiamine-monophosphate kinase